MLGVKSPLPWKMVGDQVEIQLPLKLPTDYAWVLKIRNN
jgi:hypothetical protein